MVEEDSVMGSNSKESPKENPSPDELRSALAETRASLGHRLLALEDEVQRRVIHTVDQVNHRITQTTQHISDKLTQPIELIEHQVQKVGQRVRREPIKSMALAAGVGLLCGVFFGFRRRRQPVVMLAASVDRGAAPVRYSSSRPTVLKEIAVSLGQQIIHQVIQLSFDEISRQRRRR